MEKAAFLKAGIEFNRVLHGLKANCATFEISGDDPRWQKAVSLLASLEGLEGLPKEYRVQNIPLPVPTMRESLSQMKKLVAAQWKSQSRRRATMAAVFRAVKSFTRWFGRLGISSLAGFIGAMTLFLGGERLAGSHDDIAVVLFILAVPLWIVVSVISYKSLQPAR